MKPFTLSHALILLVTTTLAACGSSDKNNGGSVSSPQGKGEAQYKLTFKGTWNKQDFPTGFPSNPHFSPIVGATHSAQTKLWGPTEQTTAGVQAVAESGNKATFITELNTKKESGYVDTVFSAGGPFDSPGSQYIRFRASKEFPLVSAISMIAPSPDWIVGIRDIRLYENGEWIKSKSFFLTLYDAGTDTGKTFSSPDKAGGDRVVKLLSTDTLDTDFTAGKHRTTGKTVAVITLEREQ